ncbi:MAG: sel1 repeat family protein [Rhodospirillales bacterium]|nr:sel1 repeat family protein [Rhodospirillales bacterium]
MFWFLFGALFIEKTNPVHQDHTARLERLIPLAEKGDVDAEFEAGIIYRDGLAGQIDERKAFKLFSRAAGQGHIAAQYALGRLYAKGQGVRQDYARAAQWYLKSAGLGFNPDAEFSLGDLYFDGRGVENDYSKAISWYRKAAFQGHAGAQMVLALMYEKGWGLERDLTESYVWFALAAEQAAAAMRYRDDIDPRRELEKLKQRMSRLQLKNGNKRFRAIRAQIRSNKK